MGQLTDDALAGIMTDFLDWIIGAVDGPFTASEKDIGAKLRSLIATYHRLDPSTEAENDGVIPSLRTWGCVELMGHVSIYGLITEEERFGTKLGRIERPTSETAYVTHYFGGQSVYRVTPMDEDSCRRLAGYRRPALSSATVPRPTFGQTHFEVADEDPRDREEEEDDNGGPF